MSAYSLIEVPNNNFDNNPVICFCFFCFFVFLFLFFCFFVFLNVLFFLLSKLDQQGKKNTGTIWDQQKDEVVVRIILEVIKYT